MYSTAAVAWLTGIIALACLLTVSINQFDQLAATSPYTQAQLDRERALELEKQCAGIISDAALEDCRLSATPMHGEGKGMLVTFPPYNVRDADEKS